MKEPDYLVSEREALSEYWIRRARGELESAFNFKGGMPAIGALLLAVENARAYVLRAKEYA